jgi:hypothetical protein
VLTEVGGRLIGIFADNLAAMLAAEPSAPAGGASSPAAGTGSPASNSASPAASGGAAVTSPAAAAEEALPIDVLNLSSRAWSSLRHDGIQTLGDLTRRTEHQLLAIDNIGRASLADIKAKLADRGLALAEAGDQPATTPVAPVAMDVNGARPSVGRHAGPEDSDTEDLAEVMPLRPARHESPAAADADRDLPAWQPPNNEAIDLLGVAGLPVLKRAVPAAAALIGVLLILLGVRRRRARRS